MRLDYTMRTPLTLIWPTYHLNERIFWSGENTLARHHIHKGQVSSYFRLWLKSYDRKQVWGMWPPAPLNLSIEGPRICNRKCDFRAWFPSNFDAYLTSIMSALASKLNLIIQFCSILIIQFSSIGIFTILFQCDSPLKKRKGTQLP